MFALDYRPRRLDELRGQNQANLVLGEMLLGWKEGRLKLPSALLFTGPRGTGKTSTARIVASYLNCLADDPPCAPDNLCDSCKAIQDERSFSVREINAATEGLVADMRKLETEARMTHGGKVRVFVLDEIHAASREAYSALLKQLEEPPPNCIYILVTTEYAAVPVTIVSRCLRFTFTSIGIPEIAAGLERVCKSEGLAYEPEVLELIAKRAQGGMRDAMMYLEHLHIVRDISVKRFNELWPNVLDEFANTFFKSLAEGDAKAGIKSIRDTFNVHRNCFYLLDAVIQRLTDPDTSLAPGMVMKFLEMAWELRVRARAENPTDPILLEAYWHLCCKELGTMTRPVVNGNKPTMAKVASDLDAIL